MTSQSVYGCHASSISLDSITFSGSDYSLYITFCVGGGVDAVMGANDNTRTFAFNFFGSPSLTLSSPTPFTPSVTSDSTGATYPGISNPGGFLGSQFAVIYQDPGTDYTCITSTVLCGRPHADCKQFMFTVTEIPDSVVLLAAEASGNPVGGCYAFPAMRLDFTTLPVTWSGFTATKINQSVRLDWSTSSESNNEHFIIERATRINTPIISHGKCAGVDCDDNGEETSYDFRDIGKVNGAGNSDIDQYYTFADPSPSYGQNFYRLRQVDFDGKSNVSSIVTVYFEPKEDLEILNLYPNPASDFLNIEWTSATNEARIIYIYDLKGSTVFKMQSNSLAGLHKDQLQLDLPRGIYTLRIGSKEEFVSRRFLME